MKNDPENDEKGYYIKNKDKIMKQFNSLIKIAENLNLNLSNVLNIHNIEEKARNELYEQLANLPYVGGDKSPFTPLMIQSAQTVALYKAIKSLNLSEREIGQLIYEIAERYAQSIPFIKKWFYRKALFSKKMKDYWREWMEESMKRKYPENWVGVFKEGVDENFDYGFDFIECGCLKLIKKENAEEIAPYVCLCDYARMRSIGVGFKRTRTLAAGAEFCDFRFIRNYQTKRGWPPDDLEEFNF